MSEDAGDQLQPPAANPGLNGDDVLYRRIHHRWIVKDGNNGTMRLSKQAFEDSGDHTPCSMHAARLLAAEVSEWVKRFPYFSIASITVNEARGCGQDPTLHPDPLDVEDGHAHVALKGPKRQSNTKCLARGAKWAAGPPFEPHV